MTREQIEAWLALEGWVAYRQAGRVTRLEKTTGEVVYRSAMAAHVICYGTNAFHDRQYDGACGFNVFPYEELQLIYQEIIKHEKD